MSGTTDAQNLGWISDKQQQRDDHYDDLWRWQRNERDAEARAAELRLVAEGIKTEMVPLDGLFISINGLHNSTTWEGNAATQSRTRLDTNEGRVSQARDMLNGLVLDLEAEEAQAEGQAAVARTYAGYAWTNISRLNGEIDELEAQLTW